jgi:hypothetical protein
MLPPHAESLRRAIEQQDFSEVARQLGLFASEVDRMAGSLRPGSPEYVSLGAEVRQFLHWARTSLRASRSHLACRLGRTYVMSRYGSSRSARPHTLHVDG